MSVTGTINVTEQDDTLIATGTQKILGTLTATEGDDTLTGWGVTTPPYTVAAHDITAIVDKSTETIITNVNEITYVTDETPDTITHQESITYVITDGVQGPAGPPTGFSTARDLIPFIGSGSGPNKTLTGIVDNVIYESFNIDGELYMTWIIPDDIDRSVSPVLEGTFFPTTDNGVGNTCSWEISVTTHNKTHTYEYSGSTLIEDIPIPATAYVETHSKATLDHALYLTNNTYILHIKLRRITSNFNTVDPIAISDINISYGTEGRVGEAGPQGPDGRPEDDVMYEKRVDFISDNELYRGEAVPGTLDSDGVWRIRKITLSAIDDDVVETWANGNDTFDKVWDDRLTYTYNY